MLTTPEQRAQWAKLDKEATPGPWEDVRETPYLDVMHGAFGTPVVMRDRGIMRDEDCDLIAAYRSAVPSLLADVEELEGLVEAARGMIPHEGDGSCEHCGRVPSVDIPTSLCDDCRDGVKRAETAEAQVERLTALLRELRADLNACGPQTVEEMIHDAINVIDEALYD